VSRDSRRFRWLLVAAAALLLALATHRFWLGALGAYLVHSDAPAPADVIVVLAGDFMGNRILTAAALARQGLAGKVLVSGPAEVYGHYESDLAIPFAVGHGYSESYFLALPNEARSTASEADVVIAELRKLHARRIDLVTSNFHTRRARNIFLSKAPDLEIHTVAAPDPYFTPDGWWENRDGRKIFAEEWAKTVANWVGM
jgi:uncharacterized SAM-binding protein YcdF (DUF218 family)